MMLGRLSAFCEQEKENKAEIKIRKKENNFMLILFSQM